jgi:NitT/TauT family transport system ATP-binding protein
MAAVEQPLLEVCDVSHEFPGGQGRGGNRELPFVALLDVSLEARLGEFISVIGPSGCGKSTLLRLMAGLSRPTRGRILIDRQPVEPGRRDVGFIFQRDALLPWKTARQNVQLALKFRGVPKHEGADRAQDWLSRFGIGKLGDRYPHQMSGGQRKRAAIAATLVYEPTLLLMDEPFSALDVQTRDLIETDILRAWNDSHQTVLFVTHDLEEAIALSDRVVVMSRAPGRIIADYRIDLERPRDLFEVRAQSEFRDLYEIIWKHLRDEVKAGFAEVEAERGTPQ